MSAVAILPLVKFNWLSEVRRDVGGDRNPPTAAGEVWKVVSAAPGYSVSNLGRVWSTRRRRPSLLKQSPLGKGYLRVDLYVGEQRLRPSVHSLVCEAFHGPRPLGMVVAHLNGSPSDNRADNLMWATPAENNRHTVAHGRANLGERASSAKLTPAKVRDLRAAHLSGATIASLARRFGLSWTAANAAASGQSWKWLEQETDK